MNIVISFVVALGVWLFFMISLQEPGTRKQPSHSIPPLARTSRKIASYEEPAPDQGALSPPNDLASIHRFLDLTLKNPSEFLPEHRENLTQRIKNLGSDRPQELAEAFKSEFTDLLPTQIEERRRLLQLAAMTAGTLAEEPFKEALLQQAVHFLASKNSADADFGQESLQTFLTLERDPAKRKLGAGRMTSIFVDLDSD